MEILLFIVGILLILLGATWLVDGASGIARKFGLSEFLIGVTIVGIGTSTPEMVVSFIAAIKGNADISIGNITGSNIFNTLFILGATALVAPITFTSGNIKRDVPIAMGASFLVLLMALDTVIWGGNVNMIGRFDGIILLICFGIFLLHSFRHDDKNVSVIEDTQISDKSKDRKPIANIILIIIGLAGLIYGGNLFVDSATVIAGKLGVSDAIIAVTIMAGGTSLPELATCIVAALKKRGQMALGNVLGSNVSNILLIIGGSAVITPQTMGKVTFLSLFVMAFVSILIFVTAFTFKKKQLDRWEGLLFLILYIAYIYAIIQI
ncbi:MAG: calcium/sodium antiporter [Bacteroidales bacterium]|nr:calcium/sodium antiporter [Bacteroidales bacterium]MDD4669939.1 calcium/sodium antiporter [Bacteroidales bacterium]